MKDKDVMFDRSCHVLYSKKCKKEIMNKLALHYPGEQIDEVFTAVQKQYSDYLKTFRTDLGGKANFHNGVAGTYDCIALFSYYVVCKDKTSVTEIVLPAMCNADFYAMELLRAKLVRKTTCGNGAVCDYTICGDKDAYLQKHKEYVDEEGYRRNE